MKVVLAFDKFKGTLTAREACEVVTDVLLESVPCCEVVKLPLADGGDGTASILLSECGGEWIEKEVCGPLPHQRIRAGYARLTKPAVHVVEMAAASGIALLKKNERDPLKATTRGTGELLADAMKHGLPVWLAVGGSATVDAGVGAAMALGWKFLDNSGAPVREGGGELERIERIIPPTHRNYPPVEVLCDVTNPLCGPDGAAHCFGPQKGANPEIVERLESGMLHFAKIIQRDFGVDLLEMPGAGAAGGLPAGARIFFNASMRPGIAAIMEATGFKTAVRDADWVITGEGSFDEQSLHGKVVSGVIKAVRGSRAKIAVLAGRVGMTTEDCNAAGIAAAYAMADGGTSVAEAMARPADILRLRTQEFVARHLRGS